DSTELGLRADRDRDEYVEIAERAGSPWHRYMMMLALSSELASLGEFARAEALSEQAFRLGMRLQEPLAEPFHAVRTLFLQFDRGAFDKVDGGAMSSDPPSCVPADHHFLWARSWLHQGRNDEARRLLKAQLSIGLDQLPLDSMRRPTLAVL